MKPIDLSKVVVCRKLSLLEHEIKKFYKSESEIIEYYRKNGIDSDKIISSDSAQRGALNMVLEYFPKAKIFEGRVLRRNFCNKDSLVIILGGDNYFQYVSHFLGNQMVIGVNSDPDRSEGALMLFNADNFDRLITGLKNGNVKIEKWIRLQIILDGKKIASEALSEVYIGSKERFNISKYKIRFKGQEEEQKSSGVLVATGSGSTGWYKSAYGDCQNKLTHVFPKNAKEAHFIVTELFRGKLNTNRLEKGAIGIGDKLEIISLGKDKNVVSIDSKLNFNFPFGSKVEIGLSENPLNVICLPIY